MFANGETMTENLFDFDTNPNFLATDYDIGVRQSIPGYDALLSMLAALFQIYLTDRAHILVVGAGGGNEIGTLGQTHPTWQFTGVDPSEKMRFCCSHESCITRTRRSRHSSQWTRTRTSVASIQRRY
jgi:tRNA (cmo5U34)-methyltransferase